MTHYGKGFSQLLAGLAHANCDLNHATKLIKPRVARDVSQLYRLLRRASRQPVMSEATREVITAIDLRTEHTLSNSFLKLGRNGVTAVASDAAPRASVLGAKK
ncbi:hypothetical protein R0137_03750 [Congregibacter brevis]|uniref:Transposase n=1 Tax=Congregibacter brevis TaxID=3081201 RepID=A0ABZ0IDT7_9GAMM|nr:hypothetical protein R0137_03750 [Congregibacter sp. IMCC45268]